MAVPFDSRNPMYRDPPGPVPDGTPVHFKITLPRSLGCSGARLSVTNGADGREETLGLFWCGMNGDRAEWWECHFSARERGVYFYFFRLDTPCGPRRLNRGTGGEAMFGVGQPWQLTVYRKEFETPDWLAGGVMYQIFPDRFFCSGREKKDVPADRKLHQSWEEGPDWKPDGRGEITNSDYFGGDLDGIREKLGHLQSLGVTCLYLNPVFEAHSNHRYDTANYEKIDPLLGDETAFRSLCREAGMLGIRVLLDGVFSHTGSDSIYFNRGGRYPRPGAYRSKESRYFPWYRFQNWPGQYDCWWGVPTLPEVKEENPDYLRYICGPDGIIRRWLRAGASGWRLDVADELPDVFLEALRRSAKAEKPDAVIAGEVWEDASNKVSYGKRRRYLLGDQLDSVMNYPFRSAVLGFLTGGKAETAMETVLSVLEHYPPQVVRLLMNNIGTHDTERALTVLAGEPRRNRDREWQSKKRLSPGQRERGFALMRCAAFLQYTLPGVPCVYYGDEAGTEGYADPFNRAPYPWGREDGALLEWYRTLGRLRAGCSCLADGAFLPVAASGDVLAYIRSGGSSGPEADAPGPEERDGEALLCAVNRAPEEREVVVPPEWGEAEPLFGALPDARGVLTLPSYGTVCLRARRHTTVFDGSRPPFFA